MYTATVIMAALAASLSIVVLFLTRQRAREAALLRITASLSAFKERLGTDIIRRIRREWHGAR